MASSFPAYYDWAWLVILIPWGVLMLLSIVYLLTGGKDE